MANNSKKYVSLTSLSNFLDNIKAQYSKIGHKHPISDFMDYTVDTELSPISTNPVQNKVIDAEFEAMATAMNALEQYVDASVAEVKAEATNQDVVVLNEAQQMAKIYADTIAAAKADKTHNHDSDYDTKGAANSALASAKSYTDTKFSNIPSVDAYTKSEIDAAFDEIDEVIDSKADASHTHSISNVTNLQSSLDAKVPTSRTVNGKALSANISLTASDVGAAPSSHNHSDLYYTETEVDTKLASKADKTHNHDADYDAKGSASAVQENLNAVSDTIDAHIDNADIHVTTTNKSNWNTAYTHSQATHARTDATKVSDSSTNGNILINGTETNVYTHPNSGVTAGTYKSVTVNAQGHITGGSNPTTLSGYGITDAESKGAASAALASAKEYTDTVASGKSDSGHNHDSDYDTKGAASSALASAKEYADSAATTAASKVKNDLLNGAGAAYDTLKELGDLIDDNTDAISALETVAAGKADKTHSHAISDVSGLQTALDGKAASSHGTHVSYSTTAPVMDGTASAGSASTVARSDHKHPTDTSRAAKTDLDTHTSNTTVHITSTERSNWNAAKTHADTAHAPSNAEKNQNAFSNIKVGSTTIAADTTTDTLELVGSNVTITPDATNDKVTIAVADGTTSAKGVVQLTNSTSSTSTTTAATPSSVKSAYDLANTAKTNAATAQTRADSAYTLAESKVDSLSDLGITATATELNYVDGVTSNIQTQLDGKAASSHALSKGTDSTASKTLSFGGTFTAVTDTAVSGHKITDTTTTYTMPSDRLFTTLVPTGTSIPANADLNTTTYMKVGRYYCSKNADAATLKNCPTNVAFMMEVYSPLSTTIDNETTKTWVYRLRKITVHNSGVQFVQYCNVGGTAGVWTYNPWKVVPLGSFTIDSNDTNGGSSATGNANKPVYINSNGYITACTNEIPVVYTANECTTFTSDSGTCTPLAVQKAVGLFEPKAHTHTVSNITDLTATAAELNYMDGVTSNVQTQLNGKAGKKVEGQTITVGDVAYVGGVNAEVFNDYEANVATGAYSHAEGYYNKASGDYSHAEGAATISSGYAGHAEGYQTNASGSASHAEGKNTAAIGQCTHAEGSGSTAVPNTITSSSSISTVETAWNSAKFTLARGTGSHAEGGNTLALNTADHSEGYETIAKGGYSHAQGYKTQATGGRAHAEGQGSKASGNDSHAEGTYTIAAGASQHTQGKYNIEDAVGKYAHIVGNGTSNTSRSNAHTLDWSGNAWFKGAIYVGGSGQADASASKLISEAELNTRLPSVTNADNGKVLMVVDGAWKAVTTQIYTGIVEVV